MALKGDVTGLATFQYGGKPVLPQQDSYQVSLQGGIVSSSFSAGLDKQLIQFQNSPYEVSVTYFAMDQSESMFIEQFLNRNRGLKFIATLLIGNTELEEFVVQYIGTPQISKTGFSGSISLTLQVEPAIDQCFNDWVYENMQCLSGAEWCQVFSNTDGGLNSWPS